MLPSDDKVALLAEIDAKLAKHKADIEAMALSYKKEIIGSIIVRHPIHDTPQVVAPPELAGVGVGDLRIIVEAATKEVLIKQVEELESTVKQHIRKYADTVILASLGLRDVHFGRLEIDSQNKTGSDILSRISQLATAELEKCVPGWFDKEVVGSTDKILDRIKDEYIKFYESNLKEMLQRQVYDIARKRAEATATNLLRDAMRDELLATEKLVVETVATHGEDSPEVEKVKQRLSSLTNAIGSLALNLLEVDDSAKTKPK